MSIILNNPTYRTRGKVIFSYIGEEWRDITVWDIAPYYMISNFGRIYSKKNDHLLKIKLSPYGYASNNLYMINSNKPKTFFRHRLLMMTFKPIENPELFHVNHIDGNKLNNYIGNLEWCTCQENLQHARETGLSPDITGENNPMAILTESQVHLICEGICERLSYSDICIYKLNMEPTDNLCRMIGAIRRGERWDFISERYISLMFQIIDNSLLIVKYMKYVLCFLKDMKQTTLWRYSDLLKEMVMTKLL